MKKNKLIILLVFTALCIPAQALVFHPEPKNQQILVNDKAEVKTVQSEALFSVHSAAETEKLGEVNIVKVGLTSRENINYSVQEVLHQAGLQNKKAMIKMLQEHPDTLILLYADSGINQLKAYTIDTEQLKKVNWDFRAYHKVYGINSCELLKDKLAKDEVLVIACTEPEGIPLNYLTWEAMPEGQALWRIHYNGKE